MATATAPDGPQIRRVDAERLAVLAEVDGQLGHPRDRPPAWRVPKAGLLARQHEAFGQLLVDLGCEVEVAPAADGMVDATYVRDPGLMTGAGAVLFQMTKPARVAEAARLAGAARAAGADFIWLDEQTMLAGRGYRTNAEGLRQLARILAAEGARLESVDLPHDRGPGHVLHLMSLISLVADDLAVV